jgi:hypothetical protein
VGVCRTPAAGGLRDRQALGIILCAEPELAHQDPLVDVVILAKVIKRHRERVAPVVRSPWLRVPLLLGYRFEAPNTAAGNWGTGVISVPSSSGFARVFRPKNKRYRSLSEVARAVGD